MYGETPAPPAKEPGMPGSQRDPRTAQDPHIIVIDVRDAWLNSEWITDEQAKALLVYAVPYSWEQWAHILGTPEITVRVRARTASEYLAEWLNTPRGDRCRKRKPQ